MSQTVHYNSGTEFGGCWFVSVWYLVVILGGFCFVVRFLGVFHFVFVLVVVAVVLICFGLVVYFFVMLHVLKIEFSECAYCFLKLPTCVDWR